MFKVFGLAIFVSLISLSITSNAQWAPKKTEILNPLNSEVIDLKSKTLKIKGTTNEQSYFNFILYAIRKPNGDLLQYGYLELVGTTFEATINLSSDVRNHRGSFLKLEILGQQTYFGIGYNFLVAGQSNTVDAGCRECGINNFSSPLVVSLADSQVDPNVQETTGATFVIPEKIKERMNSRFMKYEVLKADAKYTQGSGQGPWVFVGDYISKKYNVPVSFTVIGQAGTSMPEWSTRLFKMFEYGVGQQFSAVLWHQGESDAIVQTSKKTYKDLLAATVQRVNVLLNDSNPKGIPWVISQASRCIVQEPANGLPDQVIIGARTKDIVAIEEAQVEFLKENGDRLNLYAGPNTNAVSHRCHFDVAVEFNAYIESWKEALDTGFLINSKSNIASLKATSRPDLVPLYRGYQPSWGDHLFAFDTVEVSSYGYLFEGINMTLFPASFNIGNNTLTLHRCFDPTIGKHFIATTPACDGKIFEGALGKIYKDKPSINIDPKEVSQIFLARPIYECRSNLGKRLTTWVRWECENPYFQSIEILGWMPYEP